MAEKKSSDESVRTYLPPLYARLTKSYAEYTGMSKSEVVAEAVKKRFDEMPVLERDYILKFTQK
jgi:hypothetical protein